jgi:rare lipoprotein A
MSHLLAAVLLIALPQEVTEQTGKASWYSDLFQGRNTASGVPYDKDKLTAAHPKLPFGTRVKVTHRRSGKSVEVVINDRGPFIKGRIIDLSRKAATEIGMIEEGVAEVVVTILPEVTGRQP